MRIVFILFLFCSHFATGQILFVELSNIVYCFQAPPPLSFIKDQIVVLLAFMCGKRSFLYSDCYCCFK